MHWINKAAFVERRIGRDTGLDLVPDDHVVPKDADASEDLQIHFTVNHPNDGEPGESLFMCKLQALGQVINETIETILMPSEPYLDLRRRVGWQLE